MAVPLRYLVRSTAEDGKPGQCVYCNRREPMVPMSLPYRERKWWDDQRRDSIMHDRPECCTLASDLTNNKSREISVQDEKGENTAEEESA